MYTSQSTISFRIFFTILGLILFLCAPVYSNELLSPETINEIEAANAKGVAELDKWVRVSDPEAIKAFKGLKLEVGKGGDFPIELWLDGKLITRLAEQPLGEGTYMRGYLTSRGTVIKLVKNPINARKNLLLAWLDPVLTEYEIDHAKVLNSHPTGIFVEQEYIPGKSLSEEYSISNTPVPETVMKQIKDLRVKAERLARDRNIWLDFVPENHQTRSNGVITNIDFSPRSSLSYYCNLQHNKKRRFTEEEAMEIFFYSINRSHYFNLAEKAEISYEEAHRLSLAHRLGGDGYAPARFEIDAFTKYFANLMTTDEQIDRRMLTQFPKGYFESAVPKYITDERTREKFNNEMTTLTQEGIPNLMRSSKALTHSLEETLARIPGGIENTQVFVTGWGLEAYFNYLNIFGGEVLKPEQVSLLRLSKAVLPKKQPEDGLDFGLVFQRYIARSVHPYLAAGKNVVFIDSINSGKTLAMASRIAARSAQILAKVNAVYATGFLESLEQRERVLSEGHLNLITENVRPVLNDQHLPVPTLELKNLPIGDIMTQVMSPTLPRFLPGRYTHYSKGKPTTQGPWGGFIFQSSRDDFNYHRLQALYSYRQLIDAKMEQDAVRSLVRSCSQNGK